MCRFISSSLLVCNNFCTCLQIVIADPIYEFTFNLIIHLFMYLFIYFFKLVKIQYIFFHIPHVDLWWHLLVVLINRQVTYWSSSKNAGFELSEESWHNLFSSHVATYWHFVSSRHARYPLLLSADTLSLTLHTTGPLASVADVLSLTFSSSGRRVKVCVLRVLSWRTQSTLLWIHLGTKHCLH